MEKFLSALQADYRATTTAYVSQLLFSASTPEPVKARVLETVLSVPQEIGVAVFRSSAAYDPLPALREIKAPIVAINSDLFPTNVEGNRKYVPGYQVAIMKGVGHYTGRHGTTPAEARHHHCYGHGCFGSRRLGGQAFH